MFQINELYALPEVRSLLFASSIGLEKENVRVDGAGQLVYTPHPFGNKSQHPFIITDYSESQVEINTEVCTNPDLVYDQMEKLLSAGISPDGKAHEWPLYDLKDKKVMVLDEFDIHPETESRRKIVDWDRTYFMTKYYIP